MAELRKAEETIASLCKTYREIQQDARAQGKLPPLTTTATSTDVTTEHESENAQQSNPSDATPTTTTTSSSFTDSYHRLTTLSQQVHDLLPTMEKFQQRLQDTDPVTGNPRYGAKTSARVTKLLAIHQELTLYLQHIDSNSNNSDDQDRASSTATTTAVWIQQLQTHVQHEAQTSLEQQRQAEQQAQEKVAQAQRQQAEAALAAEQARQDALAEEERQRQARYQQQQDALAAERRAHEEAARADRAWVASIPRGSIQTQLQTLLASTQQDNDEAAQRTAIEALHQIFSQICARPEEVQFRRIRRNHPQFLQDIGRHAGGPEFLIAAGFVLGEIDGVPCYICKEPDLETDMDGWSAWFDLLKATLQLLEDQLIQL